MEENTKEMIVIDNVDRYNKIFGLETRHPLVSIINLAKSTTWPTRAWFRYEVYALYLKNVKCGDIKYGRQYYDYQDEPSSVLLPDKSPTWKCCQISSPTRMVFFFIPTLYVALRSDKK